MRKLTLALATAALAAVSHVPAVAQVRVQWNINIAQNDQAGRNYNAHTVSKHIGLTLEQARAQAIRDGKKCVGVFWTQTDANYYINKALNRNEQLAVYFGDKTLYETMRDGPLYTTKVIIKNYEDVPWYFGIYIRSLDQWYSANNVRVVMKKIPESVVLYGALVETAFPDLSGTQYEGHCR